jgi:hypothetical protein
VLSDDAKLPARQREWQAAAASVQSSSVKLDFLRLGRGVLARSKKSSGTPGSHPLNASP